MKSYTDIEQSRELEKILPLESADLYYYKYGLPHFIEGQGDYESIRTDKYHDYIPCWSLAALLNILHFRQDDIPSLSGGGYKDGNYTPDWCLDYEYDNGDYQKTFADNPVDVCVAMIERLHKINLI